MRAARCPVRPAGTLPSMPAAPRREGDRGHARRLVCPAPQDPPVSVVGLAGEFVQEARLADPRLARHEHHPALTPTGEHQSLVQDRELGIPPDERQATSLPNHAPLLGLTGDPCVRRHYTLRQFGGRWRAQTVSMIQ